MPNAEVNGVQALLRARRRRRDAGAGPWGVGDATVWRFVVPGLAKSFRVLDLRPPRPLAQRAARPRGKRRRGRRRPRGPTRVAGPGACACGHELRRRQHRPATGHQASGRVPLAVVSRAGAMGPARGGPGEPGDPPAGRSQPRGGGQADRRGGSRGRGTAIRRAGRLRTWRLGEPAAARGEGGLRAERSHLPGRAPGPEPGCEIEEAALSRLEVACALHRGIREPADRSGA